MKRSELLAAAALLGVARPIVTHSKMRVPVKGGELKLRRYKFDPPVDADIGEWYDVCYEFCVLASQIDGYFSFGGQYARGIIDMQDGKRVKL